MLRWIALVLLVLLIALQARLWTGQGGMREVWMLEQRIEAQEADNARRKARNDTLAAEVEDLKYGQEAIEERARAELGLVQPDEVFYQVVEPAPGTPAPPPAIPEQENDKATESTD